MTNKPLQPTRTELVTVISTPPHDPLARLMSQLDPIQLPIAKDLAGQLAPSSRRIYLNDLTVFLAWIRESGLEPFTLTRSDIIAYQQFLRERYAKATSNRMFVTSRRFLEEAVIRGLMPANPGASLRGFKSSVDETPHTDLTKEQANELFRSIDRSTNLGIRDYALIMLLLRTGIRRAECAALTLGDLSIKRGHNTLTIQHGKGDKRRVVKVQVDVTRSIDEYLAATHRKDESEEGKSRPLFVRILKGDHVPPKNEETPLTDKAIEQIVHRRAKVIGVSDLTPHGLRATFVTLALDGGAPLHKVQRQAGHADPRTTERYQKRKDDLDIAAGDYIHLDLQEEPSEVHKSIMPVSNPLSKPEEAPKIMRVKIWFSVQNGSKFTRGESRARQEIEQFVFGRYKMKKLHKDGYDYILSIPYETDKELDNIIGDIIQETHRTAEGRNCFAEMIVHAEDDPERRWR